MKKTFTLFSIITVAALIFAGCTKQVVIDDRQSYWLSQERGVVVYSSAYCSYYVVETNNGYAVVASTDGYRPFQNDVIYGNFSNYGIRDYYDRSGGVIISGDVKEYWLTYTQAQQATNYYCP
jgi:hypothetical protein